MKKLLSYISIFTFAVLFAAQTHIAYGIGASPLRMQLQAMPGETVEGTLKVSNSKDNAVRIVARKADFVVTENEAVQFLDEIDKKNIHSMQEWIELPSEDIIIEAKNDAKYTYKINIPEDAISQSYYGVVFVGDENVSEGDASGSGISLNTQVAHLVLIEVGENLHADIALQSFEVSKNKTGESLSAQFDTVFFNSGNTHAAQEGRIIVTDKNKNILNELPVNKGKFNNLPKRQKTSTEIWEIAEIENGTYFAYFEGTNPSEESLNAEVKFRIADDKENEGKRTIEMLESNLGISLEDAMKQDSKIMLLKLIIIAIGISLLAGYSAVKVVKKRKMAKKIFRIFGVILLLVILSNITINQVMAQDADTISVSMEVDAQLAELTLVGCWEESAADTWTFTDTDATLLQPGDREAVANGSGDPYAWYDTAGSSANGNVGPTDGNAFAYDDCQFNVSVVGYSEYDITLHAGDFTNGTNDIPDMKDSATIGFDFTMTSENPSAPYDYVSGEGEHGFFLVDSDITTLSDTGTAAGVSYTTAKDFDATTCGTGSNRPCYHLVPASGSPQTIFDENAGISIEDQKFVIRVGMAADFSFPAGTYAMASGAPYNSTPLTITLTPTP